MKDPRAAVAVAEWEYRERPLGRRPGFDRMNARRLTRELWASGTPLDEVWTEHLEHACGRLGIKSGELRRFLQRSWAGVMTGRDRWGRAAERAPGDFDRFRGVGKKWYDAHAAALAYNLCALNDGGWFPFPSCRLAEFLGVHRDTADEIVRRLEKDALIEVRRDESGRTDYDFKAGNARDVRWKGDWWLPKSPAGGERKRPKGKASTRRGGLKVRPSPSRRAPVEVGAAE